MEYRSYTEQTTLNFEILSFRIKRGRLEVSSHPLRKKRNFLNFYFSPVPKKIKGLARPFAFFDLYRY